MWPNMLAAAPTAAPAGGIEANLGIVRATVDRLLDGGWDPKHVALLTTGHRHPIQVERTDFHDQEGYWRTYWDDDVFYGHVLGCKGLERRAVVLCLNEDGSRDRARERLYVGMSRATGHTYRHVLEVLAAVIGMVVDQEVVFRQGGRRILLQAGAQGRVHRSQLHRHHLRLGDDVAVLVAFRLVQLLYKAA